MKETKITIDEKTMKKTSRRARQQYSLTKIIAHLKEIKDICRENKWYASASYVSLASDSLFHMQSLGDKAQRPDFIVHLTDIHYSAYPDEADQEDCD